jgi:hypothetical protein
VNMLDPRTRVSVPLYACNKSTVPKQVVKIRNLLHYSFYILTNISSLLCSGKNFVRNTRIIF